MIKYLSQEQVHAVLQAAKHSPRDFALLLTAYRHGLRASEVGILRREDFDRVRLRLRIHRLKNGLGGEYPVQPDVGRALTRYLRGRKDNSTALFPSREGSGISRIRLHNLFQGYARKAGLPSDLQHFHVLRHSICTHLMDAGADVAFVRDWAGHRNIQNTMVYAQITNRRRDEDARRLFAGGRISR